MSKALRRRTDARDPLERLTTEQWQDIHLRGLSEQVSRACDFYLKARGIAAPSFAGEYPGKTAATRPELSSKKTTTNYHHP